MLLHHQCQGSLASRSARRSPAAFNAGGRAKLATSSRASIAAAAAQTTQLVDVAPTAQVVATHQPIKKVNAMVALIFDCDGVIVETEELHRQAYNAAFEAFGLTINGEPVVWTTEYYDILQNTVGGGKPKMKHHFNKFGWPSTSAGPVAEAEHSKLVDDLQDKKTEHYKIIVEQVACARPGVLELMDEGLARDDIAMCICSAATKEGFEKVVNSVVGPERLAKFDIILAGDDVRKKKPDPMIYNMARERLGIPATKCVVIEDSMVGLRAATAAGMHCIITPTSSTASAPFCEEGAAAVVDQLAGPLYQVTINDIFTQICQDDVCELAPDVEGIAAMGDVCDVWSVSPKPFTM